MSADTTTPCYLVEVMQAPAPEDATPQELEKHTVSHLLLPLFDRIIVALKEYTRVDVPGAPEWAVLRASAIEGIVDYWTKQCALHKTQAIPIETWLILFSDMTQSVIATLYVHHGLSLPELNGVMKMLRRAGSPEEVVDILSQEDNIAKLMGTMDDLGIFDVPAAARATQPAFTMLDLMKKHNLL